MSLAFDSVQGKKGLRGVEVRTGLGEESHTTFVGDSETGDFCEFLCVLSTTQLPVGLQQNRAERRLDIGRGLI